MNILGIETSCDETAAAVVVAGERELSNVVASQFDVHARYGGVVPELASRQHLEAITPVVREALERAGMQYADLDAVAVTYGPGLVGCLLVGLTYAKGLALALGKPFIGINHLEGHIHAVVMEQRRAGSPAELPAIAMVVSGGHTHLFLVEETTEQGYDYKLLGKTRDDAAGEAFDKVAKLLGYPYPGGPLLDLLAPFGDPQGVALPGSRMKGNQLDMSFSGLKTAVLRHVQASDMADEIAERSAALKGRGRIGVDEARQATPQATLDLIASFQSRVVEELLKRAAAAADETGAQSLILCGGVAANSGLRARFQSLPVPVYASALSLSTDNAAMIAAAAYPRLLRGESSPLDLRAQPNLKLA
jgi:N6-L-threonylcarbamoyladenine synthase